MVKVLSLDESHFEVHGQWVSFVRRGVGEKTYTIHLQQAPKTSSQKMFLCCCTYKWPGPLVPVEGMMKSDQYIQILERRVIPQLQTSLPEDDGIFQQDLAQFHKSQN